MYSNYLNQIINTILINTQFISDAGLMKGRLGIALLLYNYSRYSGYELYRDYADSLIDNVCDNISQHTPRSFNSGISGIGWGIDYLIKNRFVDGESNILEDFDASVSKMTGSDFQSEIKSDDPLFSKGLYFSQRGINDKIAETLTECLFFLLDNVTSLPASYLNSIFYTVNRAVNLNTSPELCGMILDKLYSVAHADFPKYSNVDLYALGRNIKNITDPDRKEKWQKLVDQAPKDVGLLERGWIHFVYQYDHFEDTAIGETELKETMENTIRRLDPDNLPLHNGLVGLGLELMSYSK